VFSIAYAGGPAWIRTKNQQIMSPSTGSENKDTTSLPSAESGKVLQNPQPRATSWRLILVSSKDTPKRRSHTLRPSADHGVYRRAIGRTTTVATPVPQERTVPDVPAPSFSSVMQPAAPAMLGADGARQLAKALRCGAWPSPHIKVFPFSVTGCAHYPSATPQRSLMAARSHGQGFVLGPSGIGGRDDDAGV
jgi:hypothetical protein